MTSPAWPKFEASRTAIGLLWAYALVASLTIPLRFWKGDGRALEMVTVSFIGVFQLLAILGFGSWFRSAYAKLGIVGVQTRYTPAMALVIFFIPFSNLFRPGEIVAELYAGSEPGRLRQTSRRRSSGPRAATFWWYCFLGSLVAGDVATAFHIREGHAQRLAPLILIAASQFLGAGAAIGATRFVGDIRDRQRRCAILLRLDGKTAQSAMIEEDALPASRRLTSILRVLLVATGILRTIVITLLVLRMSGLDVRPFVLPLAGLTSWVALATLTAFLLWVERVVSNIGRLSPFAQGAGFAAGGFFIPFFNLVHPLVLMQRIWQWLDRINGGIEHYDYAPIEVAAAKRPRSTLIDVWWTTVCVELLIIVLAVSFRDDVDLPRSLFVIVTVVEFALALLTIGTLFNIVSTIGAKVASMEAASLGAQELILSSTAADPATPRATWTEVLLPIASTIDTGLREEGPDLRRERELVERARDAEEEAARTSTFYSASTLTKTLRVLLLFAIFVAFAEGFTYIVFVPGSHHTVGTLLAICVGAAVCGLPPWLMLSRWAAAQYHNGVSLRRLNGDPHVYRRRILRFREPGVFRALWIASSSSPTTDSSFTIWQGSLRILQAAPIWLTVASVGSDYVVMGGGALFVLNVTVCLSLTATMIREIDSRFEEIHQQKLEPARQTDAPRPLKDLSEASASGRR
ncbi:MAG: DUF4328 domain-containing protein [Acidobacteriota bacterium]